MKLLVTGYSEHGKDSFCELLNKHSGMTFISSSEMALNLFMWNELKSKYNYKNKEECFNDRRNKRGEWFDAICLYNKDDLSKLGEAIFNEYDIYCGIRSFEEYQRLKEKKLYDYTVWVDASKRVVATHSHSLSLAQFEPDFIIDNNGTLDELEKEVQYFISVLFS